MNGSALKYRPEIDGLRAIAVVPVVLFHAEVPPFTGGFVGVDVFFVISGFQITGILLGDLASGKFSIAMFYDRRIRRILPALFLVTTLTALAALAVMGSAQLVDFSYATLATALFASNFLFALRFDYFAPAADENPLLHTWSLAVEEQFYLFFPLLLAVLWKASRARAFWSIVAISVLSFISAQLVSQLGDFMTANTLVQRVMSANFYMLPTRAWELGIGSILAFLVRDRTIKPNDFWPGSALS